MPRQGALPAKFNNAEALVPQPRVSGAPIASDHLVLDVGLRR
jgi:hypothetical protein